MSTLKPLRPITVLPLTLAGLFHWLKTGVHFRDEKCPRKTVFGVTIDSLKGMLSPLFPAPLLLLSLRVSLQTRMLAPTEKLCRSLSMVTG